MRPVTWLGISLALSIWMAGLALANGGPFVVKYPGGDPAAKGVLARLDPDLKPRRETRLRVVREDLKVRFDDDINRQQPRPPLARVFATYTIENPTDEEIQVDFGFPILRGIYVDPRSMMPRPDVQVSLVNMAGAPAGEPLSSVVSPGGRPANDGIPSTVISNSTIYGIIRQQARREIDQWIARDGELARLIFAARGAEPANRETARAELVTYLTRQKSWNPRDAALMVEYAGLELGEARYALPGGFRWSQPEELHRLAAANMGSLAAIGEQKATQFFAQLASQFNPKAGASYEAIFSAWGGDVRERSLDLVTGKLRPREFSVDPKLLEPGPVRTPETYVIAADPTVYARVDYLDQNSNLTEEERASCKSILKNLPVVFTFAPMNLLHYQVKFPPKSAHLLTVSYSQYPYLDTRSPRSYQLAYVVHPASLWDHFGPINLQVVAPEGASFRASVACRKLRSEERTVDGPRRPGQDGEKMRFATYQGTVNKKTGELFLAVGADAWRTAAQPPSQKAAPARPSKG